MLISFQHFRMAVIRSSLQCGDFAWTSFFSFHQILSIGIESGLLAGQSMVAICLSARKSLTYYALCQEALSSQNTTSSSPKALSMDGIRKWSKMSVKIRELTVVLMTANSPAPLLDMQAGRRDLYLFLNAAVWISFVSSSTNECSSIVSMSNANPWLVTEYYLFSIIYSPCALIFSSL